MFEIRVFVDDKKLSHLLWSLDSQIIGQPQILPVRGASSRGGKLISSGPNGGSIRSRVLELIRKKKLKVVSTAIIKPMLEEAGASPLTLASNVIEGLKKMGALGPPSNDKPGQAKTYRVLRPKKGK